MGIFQRESWYRAKHKNISWFSSHFEALLSKGWLYSVPKNLISINLFLIVGHPTPWLPDYTAEDTRKIELIYG